MTPILQKQQTWSHVEHEGISFVLVQGKVKNLNLRITHDGTVRVSAPRQMPMKTILAFISEKKDWITLHANKLRPDKDCFFYLGNQLSISDIQGKTPDAFLAEKAGSVLSERYNICCKKLSITNAPHLVIKPLRGKYGYYTKTTHEICLNGRLIMVPTECIDYVIVHELLHTKYFNHGKEFHKSLRAIIPNEKALRSLLGKYILW